MTDTSPGRHLVRLGAGPVYYLPVPKCGSSQVLQLAHLLAFGPEAAQGSAAVHGGADALPRGTDLIPGALPDDAIVVSFARAPLDRFLSLYFDKIWNPDHPDPHPMMEWFQKLVGTRTDPRLTPAQHVENCHRALNRIEKSLDPTSDWTSNPHWEPQIRRFRQVAGLDLRLATLEGLNPKVLALLPEAEARIGRGWARDQSNRSRRAKITLDTRTLAPRVNTIYARDWALWQALVRADKADPDRVFHDFTGLRRAAGL